MANGWPTDDQRMANGANECVNGSNECVNDANGCFNEWLTNN